MTRVVFKGQSEGFEVHVFQFNILDVLTNVSNQNALKVGDYYGQICGSAPGACTP